MKTIEFALLAGKKRLSPRTGFVHLFPEDEALDTIPLYENFCFAFALMRQKTAEGVLAGKELLERLLAFQLPDGNFPVYLHDFPKAHDWNLKWKIGAILTYIVRQFPTLIASVETPLEKILSSPPPEKPLWRQRYAALKGEVLEEVRPTTSNEWTEWVITQQLAGVSSLFLPFDADLQKFLPETAQEKGEPRPHPLEWVLAEKKYADHPHQLWLAPLFPISYTPIPWIDSNFRSFWKGSVLHSLEGVGLHVALQDPPKDLFEVGLYCNRSSETTILINGQKGTAFRLEDQIAIHAGPKIIELTFHLVEGSGDFCGHVFPANRPSQKAKGFEAYDWFIGLRTLRRSNARIEIRLNERSKEKLLSEAPDCLLQVP